MIKFFRKIRQRLLSENKFSKYLLYAIGEIILVVIGILIALQINNWNQDRLERKNEHKILKDLKVEFDVNFNDLSRVVEQHKIVLSEFNAIQHSIVSKTYDPALLDSLMLSTTKWFSFTERPGASDNLINSGNLNLLSNETLRDLITQWSGVVDDVIDDELFGIDFTRNTFVPFIAKHYPASNMEYPQHKFFIKATQNKSLDITPIILQKDVDWDAILNNTEFQSLLSLRKMYEIYAINETQAALQACNKIRTLVNSELEK